MKMKYVKPAMCIELYSLTESIAVSCANNGDSDFGKNLWANGYDCVWEHYDFGAIFNESNRNCVYLDSMLETEMGCYNNPVGEPSMFGS